MENINNFTLDFLSKPCYKNENLKKNIEYNEEELKKMYSFYKKRIVEYTKKMLKGKYDNPTLKNKHTEYIFSLIQHFKKLDETEFMQKEYADLETNSKDTIKKEDIAIKEEDSNLIFCNNNNKKVSLDNFVIKNKIDKNVKKIIYPKKKNFNSLSDEYKLKGLKIKNNDNDNDNK